MAALTLADQLSETKEKLQRLEPELATLRNASVASADRTQATQTAVVAALNAAAERIENITKRLNETVHGERRPDGMTIAFHGWRYGGLRTTLVERGCEARKEPYSWGLIDPQGSCP